MKNLSKKLEYIISIIVILTLISLTMKTCSQNNTIREKDLLINSLNDTVKIYNWIKTGLWPVCWNVFQINGNGVMWQGSWPDTKPVNHCPSGL